MTQLLAPCPFCGGAARAPKAIGGHSSAFRIVQCSRSDSCGSVAGSTDAEAIAAWNTRTDPERDALKARVEALVEEMSIPSDIAELVSRIGRAEWGQTEAFDASGHAAHVAESVELTGVHFGQEGPQHMHGLYIEGTGIVICHTGTSPNSPQIARALTGAWNQLVARTALAKANQP